MAHWLNPPPEMTVSHWAPVYVPAPPLLNDFLAHGLEKATEDEPSTAPHKAQERLERNSWLPLGPGVTMAASLAVKQSMNGLSVKLAFI